MKGKINYFMKNKVWTMRSVLRIQEDDRKGNIGFDNMKVAAYLDKRISMEW